MSNFNNDWKFQKEIEKKDGSFLRKVYKTNEKFSSGRDKYVAYFQRGKTFYKHEAMKMNTKATGKPFMKFSIKSEVDKNFKLQAGKTLTYEKVLGLIKPGYKFYTLKMQAERTCGEKKFWLIVDGQKTFAFEDYCGQLKLADDLDKYYIEKFYKNEPVEKARWETYDVRDFYERPDLLLDYKYKKYQARMREVMKNEFLEDLVKYVCHPSRASKFESLGFFD